MRRPERCWRRNGWAYIRYADDVMIAKDVTCGANTCPYCIHTNAWQMALVVGFVRPSRYAVFTQVQERWEDLRPKINRLFQILDRKGYELHAVYSTEVNPKGTGYHLNVWWWGPDVPQALLTEAAESVGWGQIVHVQRFSVDRGGAGYGMKDAVGYGMKDAVNDSSVTADQLVLTPQQQTFLDRNGGRLMNYRKNFLSIPGKERVLVKTRREILRMQREQSVSPRAEQVERSSSWVMLKGSEVLAASSDVPRAWETPTESTGQPTTVSSPLPASPPATEQLTLWGRLLGCSSEPVTSTRKRSGNTLVSSGARSSP